MVDEKGTGKGKGFLHDKDERAKRMDWKNHPRPRRFMCGLIKPLLACILFLFIIPSLNGLCEISTHTH